MKTTRIDLGHLRRVTPFSYHFGYERGTPIDRYYIEKFLTRHLADIQGRVLEIGDNTYTRQFGGNRVTKSDVLHISQGNPGATFGGDLTQADHIPTNTFDCFILTQTLHLIFDVQAALRTVQRILKPNGVVLATFPGISQISRDEWAKQWCWSFTAKVAKRLFMEVFSPETIEIRTFGNQLTTAAFLQGLAMEELDPSELDYHDPRYEMLITTRAVK